MLEKITERVQKVSEGVFTSGSRAGTPQENGISTVPHSQENLLIAIIILVIIVFALILIIIYGYYKYVRGRGKEMKNEGREQSNNIREATGDFEQPSPSEALPEFVPVKMRKRSMTFSETDEECRKYRENLADSSNKEKAVENDERSRKKSAVTFVGVKEVDANES